MGNLLKVAVHPLALVIGFLAFVGTILGQPPFNLPPAVTFPIVFVVAVLTYLSAQLPAFHKDLVIEVPEATFKTIVTVLVALAGLIALLAQSLAASPYSIPAMVVYVLAAVVSVLTFVANQLQAVDPAVGAQSEPPAPFQPQVSTSSTSSAATVSGSGFRSSATVGGPVNVSPHG